MLKGADFSYHNGEIDFKKVKNQIDFVILRCGYGNDVLSQDDKKFIEYANECEKLNIPYGIYFYSYATNENEINSEIKHCLRLIKNFKPTLPIFFDVEEKRQQILGTDVITDYVIKFCEELKKNGYKSGVYANKWWLSSILDYDRLSKHIDYIWVAQYNSECTFKGKYDIWQYTSTGTLKGVNGYVDLNCLINDELLNLDKEKPKEDKQDTIIYKVVKNDNLTKIAKMFNTTVDKLVKDNNIENPDLIYVDQELVIKTNDSNEIIYTVVKNDNLTKIAKMFNTTVDKLVKDNNIENPDLIYPDQKIVIK